MKMLQSPPVRAYHLYRDSKEVGLDIAEFDLSMRPLRLYDDIDEDDDEDAPSGGRGGT